MVILHRPESVYHTRTYTDLCISGIISWGGIKWQGDLVRYMTSCVGFLSRAPQSDLSGMVILPDHLTTDHLIFDTKLSNGVCAIRRIPCACVACISMLEKPWISGIPSYEQEIYKPVTKCTYWPVLGYFNNWNIIQLSQNSTPSDAFDEIHQVVLDGIIDNIASLVELVKYGSINKTDTATNGFYVIMFTSEAYTLQDNTTIDGQIITAGELVVKAQYVCSMQVDNNWYWNQHPQQHVITVPTCTILHP